MEDLTNKHIVKVAFGEQNSRYAAENDPEAKNINLKNKNEGCDVWHVYIFDTEKEAVAFSRGVSVAQGWLESYIVY